MLNQTQNRSVLPPVAGRLYRFRSAAFTLVEILIVVVILGILAAIAIPKLSDASQISRENTLKEDLRFMRTQILVYQTLHNNVCPGYPAGDITQTPTESDFTNQMTLYTDIAGNTAATPSTTFKYGPYLSQIPMNPVGSKTNLKIVLPGGSLAPDGTSAWLYEPDTASFVCNNLGSDSAGKLFSSY